MPTISEEEIMDLAYKKYPKSGNATNDDVWSGIRNVWISGFKAAINQITKPEEEER